MACIDVSGYRPFLLEIIKFILVAILKRWHHMFLFVFNITSFSTLSILYFVYFCLHHVTENKQIISGKDDLFENRSSTCSKTYNLYDSLMYARW